jgi:hypothetical protein
MLLLLIPQGTASTSLDLRNCISDVIYRLGLTGAADLAAQDWVSNAELYQFADDTIKEMTFKHGLTMVWDTSITINSGTAAYNLPAADVFVVMAWLIPGAGTPSLLRPTSVRDLAALDESWPQTSGSAARVSFDAGAPDTATIYPNPTVGGTFGHIAQQYPAAVTEAAPLTALPLVCQDYLSYAMLAGARGKESEFAQMEMAKHYRERMSLYEQVFESLWGPGL